MSVVILRFSAVVAAASVSAMLNHLAQNGYGNIIRAQLRKKVNRSLKKLVKNGSGSYENGLYMVVPLPHLVPQ